MPSPGKRFLLLLTPCLVAICVLASGCDKSSTGKLFPVSGKVVAGKTPVPIGTVTFHPDKAKGNTLTESPIGTIGTDGTYKLITGGNEGAPAGWYKVTVSPTGMPKEMPPAGQPLPKAPNFDARFQKADATPLSIQVVENPAPGSYDIELK